MLKCVMPSAWDYGSPYLQPLKISSRGLMDNDRRALVKAAGDRVAEAVRRVKLARDEVGALLTAMGATEYYGPNRNGDGFREGPLIQYHPNFVKRAKPFRDHDNRPSSPHYGRVVDSLYDYPMHRVALVVAYNGGPAAIEKNGGYLADLEIDDLERGREFPVSMATSVPYDTCSSCGNKARTRAQYCKEGSCPHGGLHDNIGRVFADGHHLHADNPTGLEFFDISRVRKPADRTAYTFGKVAGVIGTDGAALAEGAGLILPHWLQAPPLAPAEVVNACKVAGVLADVSRRGLGHEAMAPATWAPLPGLPEGATLRDAFAALASVKAAASLREFLELAAPGQGAALLDPVAAHLPGAIASLAADPDLAEKLAASESTPSECAPMALHAWAKRAAHGRALDRESVRSQAALAAIREASPRRFDKSAYAHLSSAAAAAEEFALHRIAVVARLAGEDDGEACRVGRVLLGSDLLT